MEDDWNFLFADNIMQAAMLCMSFEMGSDYAEFCGRAWHPGCGMDPEEFAAWSISCDECGSSEDYYMVHDRVWNDEAGLEDDGMLCIPCLEGRIGRKLVPYDFPVCPLNENQGLCDETSVVLDYASDHVG